MTQLHIASGDDSSVLKSPSERLSTPCASPRESSPTRLHILLWLISQKPFESIRYLPLLHSPQRCKHSSSDACRPSSHVPPLSELCESLRRRQVRHKLTPILHLKTASLVALKGLIRVCVAELQSQPFGIQKRTSVNNTTRRWTYVKTDLDFCRIVLPLLKHEHYSAHNNKEL